jgi:predicted nucleic acid-binding protein
VTLIVDAALVVAALVDDGDDGRWAESIVVSDHLAAPHLMPVETANFLRRSALAGEVSEDTASQAHADLLALRVDLIPYEPVASRVWELRSNLTAYDAWYVAVAEALDAPLATLDTRLSRASGSLCPFRTLPR